MINEKQLITAAINARKSAYTPYSKFKVGAALLTKDGKIYTGCNIECASYSGANCAERTALFKAVSDGHSEFKAIAVVGGKSNLEDSFNDYCPPCGICRQVLREFCDPNEFQIIIAKSADEYKTFLFKDILPMSFGPDNLK